jgi:hypothetical protein
MGIASVTVRAATGKENFALHDLKIHIENLYRACEISVESLESVINFRL